MHINTRTRLHVEIDGENMIANEHLCGANSLCHTFFSPTFGSDSSSAALAVLMLTKAVVFLFSDFSQPPDGEDEAATRSLDEF